MFSGKYIFSGNANFRKRKIFPCVWLHFKKFSGKYFLVFGKEEGKYKSRKTKATTQKKLINDDKARSRPCRRSRSEIAIAISPSSRDRDRRLREIFHSDLAIFLDGSSSRISRPKYNMSRSRIFLSRRQSQSRSGAISPRRDRDQRHDLATARSRPTARSHDGEIAFDASPLARARSLSLSHFPEMLWRENRSLVWCSAVQQCYTDFIFRINVNWFESRGLVTSYTFLSLIKLYIIHFIYIYIYKEILHTLICFLSPFFFLFLQVGFAKHAS